MTFPLLFHYSLLTDHPTESGSDMWQVRFIGGCSGVSTPTSTLRVTTVSCCNTLPTVRLSAAKAVVLDDNVYHLKRPMMCYTSKLSFNFAAGQKPFTEHWVWKTPMSWPTKRHRVPRLVPWFPSALTHIAWPLRLFCKLRRLYLDEPRRIINFISSRIFLVRFISGKSKRCAKHSPS